MPPTRIAAVALFGAAAIGLSAPVAAALDSPVGSVSPTTVKPGGTVHLKLENCKAHTARADAGGAFGPVNLEKKAYGTFEGEAEVFDDAKPGAEYEVKFWCGQKADGTATLTIASGHPTHDPTHDPTHKPTHEPTHPAGDPTSHPSHGTQGGEGGSVKA